MDYVQNAPQNCRFSTVKPAAQAPVELVESALMTACLRKSPERSTKTDNVGFGIEVLQETESALARSPTRHPDCCDDTTSRRDAPCTHKLAARREFRLSQASASRHNPTIGNSAKLTAFQPMASSSLPDVRDAVATVANTQKSLTA